MCICVFACVILKFFFKNTAGHVPAREITIIWGEGRGMKRFSCYNMGENCQQVLLIGAYFIQCWCVVVLVHICLFNHPFFPLGGGVPRQGVGLVHEREEGIEYFVIVQSEGDSMYISILYICDENALAFCVTLPFTCTMVLHSVFQC